MEDSDKTKSIKLTYIKFAENYVDGVFDRHVLRDSNGEEILFRRIMFAFLIDSALLQRADNNWQPKPPPDIMTIENIYMDTFEAKL